MEHQWHVERAKSTSSNSGRSFFTRNLIRDNSDLASDNTKGPLGLTTLFAPGGRPIADLVFVHGLGGGSRSTWTKSQDSSLFWPQEWLPQDEGFKDVRIHSFGYNSNWEKESTLNIHDFAKSLLGSIKDCPAIPQESKASLVLIGHSMGGLVIKKAFILARQHLEFEALARRVRSIFFLATPHRGADLAQLLSKILQVSAGARPFVTDLHRNSLATQSINDEFPQHCQGLQLYSFYETLAINYGLGKSLVVDKDLATLGYHNERTEYLNANHRDVCRYTTPLDPNYLTVRNALAATIENLRSQTVESKRDLDSEQHRILNGFLGVTDAPEDDLMNVDALRMKGSCEWLLRKANFHRWRDSSSRQMYWISAKPAAGKSVLSGYVVKHLKDLDRDCNFYFFAYGHKVKSTITSFLRTMAWQMAVMHPEALEVILKVCEKDDQVCKADYRTIWRKLFLEGLLKLKLDRPQYWVIDALDECKADAELVSLLLKAIEVFPVHIFVTSRNRFESHRQIVHSTPEVVSEEILVKDSRSDILLYLNANMNDLPSVSEEAHQNMVDQILEKSAGCFLWVSLILQELRQVHTSAEIRQVLEEVPSDMDELYSRILDSMSRAPYGKVLAKAILTWTVCSARPLTTDELYHALQIDIKDTIDDVRKAIIASCGQLVYVDQQSQVQMVHQTAQDFLLRAENTSEFAINSKTGHKRLAMTCLQYLNGNELKSSKHRKLSVSSLLKDPCPFVAYACNSLFEHITHVSSTDEDILIGLAKFLNSSNVLSWIEHLAQNSDLDCLIRTGEAFRHFLQRRSKHMSPFGREVVTLDSWATDLVRLVTKFGKNLSASPSSIVNLIPPFCPPESAPRKQFAASTRGIAVLGLSATTWDDCLSTIVYTREHPSALACSAIYFAVGLSSGNVVIYHEMSCQEAQILQHQEPVKLLQFGETGNILVSSGMKVVRIWDVTARQELWKFDISHQCMSLALTDEDRLLLGALKNNQLAIWDLTTGSLRECANWTQNIDGQRAHSFRRPTAAAFSMELSLLAVVYRGQDILLWDLERDTLHETYGKETGARSGEKRIANATVWSLVFSPAPGATLLAAAYSDGDLVLFDTSEGVVKEMTLANAQALASSPNGRTLASGDSSGTIQLFDFESLKVLYRISLEDHGIKSLAFSGDSHHLLDIRGSQCRVWDPTVLFRQDTEEDHSDTVSISTAPQEILLEASEDLTLVTALACHEHGEAIFCGKENGSVCLYETKSGRQIKELFSHADGVSIVSLFFDDESQILSSADSSSRVMTHKLTHQQNGWEAAEAVFNYRTGVAVDQLLSNRGHTRMLVCSENRDMLYSTTSKDTKLINTVEQADRSSHTWGSHPLNQNQLILVANNVAHIYDWQTLAKLGGAEGILLQGTIVSELSIRSITPCFKGTLIATTFSESLETHARSNLLLWSTSDFSERSQTAVPVPNFKYLADQVEVLIGAYGQRLVFLHSSGWVCSTDSETFSIVRHFFLPADWLSTNNALMIEVTRNGDIIFVKRDEIAVIKRGLDTSEQGLSNTLGKRPSLAASVSSS
ncbi:MAG: hypothetical protein FRX48_03801 [Lasallia pustulata]|uniref:GPI inositol-deacylase n=1 Tax=Lasallia pustulata TaxID=136370 RepID=A0A5M8PUU3_9LECA|nr:MAG: hypothetical protein FRX48_03801 [Lasallia pustulata]